MNLQSQEELENTEHKLREAERVYEKCKAAPGERSRAREQTLLSLKRVIKQLKEDILRYRAKSGVKAK